MQPTAPSGRQAPSQDGYDLLVVGGGINGAGIARDAAGRGLRVLLVEQHDLAQHTSSASTKLVHGGLRYLEYFEFKLVRKALREREVLLRLAPHVVAPLRFVMPHDAGQRPAWLLRCGLFLYDHLARRAFLPGTESVDLSRHEAGRPLKEGLRRGFLYSDGWTDDARLTLLNALDASERGATVLTRTRCEAIRRAGDGWQASLCGADGSVSEVRARAVVNAAGAWAAKLAAGAAAIAPVPAPRHALRLVKGSHIVVPRLPGHSFAYLLQNPDGRILFAIPFQGDFTLLGTTDVEFSGDPAQVAIEPHEIDYLCRMAGRWFRQPVRREDVVWTYSGVRALLDDGAGSASAITREYLLECAPQGPPFLNVWGGKITTYRQLAEDALALLLPRLGMAAPVWTAGRPLPGGDLERAGELSGPGGFDLFLRRFSADHPWLPEALAWRWVRAYGSRAESVLGGAESLAALGAELTPGLHEREAQYLRDVEWARTAEDVLWRRSKLGLRCKVEDVARLERWFEKGGCDVTTCR